MGWRTAAAPCPGRPGRGAWRRDRLRAPQRRGRRGRGLPGSPGGAGQRAPGPALRRDRRRLQQRARKPRRSNSSPATRWSVRSKSTCSRGTNRVRCPSTPIRPASSATGRALRRQPIPCRRTTRPPASPWSRARRACCSWKGSPGEAQQTGRRPGRGADRSQHGCARDAPRTWRR